MAARGGTRRHSPPARAGGLYHWLKHHCHPGYDMGVTTSDIHTEFWHRDPRARQLVLVGLVLVASGLAHGAVWALIGGPWEGPITWRKPILFGISGGLTSLSLGWIWSTLPRRRGDGWLPTATAWALFVEVLLIDLQRWRGVASHFNRATPLDSILYDAMGVLILFVTAVIVDLTVRLVFSRVALTPDLLLAARAGMVLLAVSCGLGIWVSINGDLRVAAGLDPEGYGVAGVAKFPHGAVIHAIQWLPAIAWITRRAGITEGPRWWLVALTSALTVALLVFALAQTLAGRARFDVSWWRPADLGCLHMCHRRARGSARRVCEDRVQPRFARYSRSGEWDRIVECCFE